MSESQREILLGYLSGALDENENRKVQQELERNESLRLEFAALRKEMRPLAQYAQLTDHAYQPPKGLAKRTCRRIWEQADGDLQTADTRHRSPERRASIRNPKRNEWKSANIVPAICVSVMVLLLLFPTFRFVKNQVVQIVTQKHMNRIANNTAALSQMHEEYLFQNVLGNMDYSVAANAGGTDLGTYLASFGETNLSQKTLDFFPPDEQGIKKFAVSPQISVSTLVGRFPVNGQAQASPQYIQSIPLPQISHLFNPNATVSSQSPEKPTGLAYVEWYGTSPAVFTETGGGSNGTLMNVSSEQNLIFRDGRVFFRKVGTGQMTNDK